MATVTTRDTATREREAVRRRGGRPRVRTSRRVRLNPLGALGGLIWLLIVVVPLYWIVVTSLRNQAGFFGTSPLALPTDPTFDNFRLVLQSGFFRYLANSTIVTLAAVVLSTLPILTLYVIGRRYLVSGLTAGFSK